MRSKRKKKPTQRLCNTDRRAATLELDPAVFRACLAYEGHNAQTFATLLSDRVGLVVSRRAVHSWGEGTYSPGNPAVTKFLARYISTVSKSLRRSL